ncbi:MAG: hypothetical protein PWQ55_1666 [Chloroflexota bacterium]|nr:hypothetical protein [Chloroflexota bacterium]
MEEKNKDVPQSQSSDHGRQTFWQIYFPLLVAAGGAAAIFILLFGKSAGGGADLRVWADIAAILIILPLLMVVLVWIALTLVSSALTVKASSGLKSGLAKVRHFSLRLMHSVASTSTGIRRTWEEVDAYRAGLSEKYFK